MKSIWMLAAAVTFTACAGRGEDDMGAAPDRGDETTVTADTAQWDTTDTGGVGQTAEPGMIPDTLETTQDYPTTEYPTTPADTALGQDPGMTGGFPEDTTVETDTAGMGGYGDPAVGVDTTDAYGTPEDTGAWDDTTGVDQGAEGWEGDTGTTGYDDPTVDTTQAH